MSHGGSTQDTSLECRFHIVGGECNYLLRVGSAPERRLEFVPDGKWKSDYMMSWSAGDIATVLDEAGSLLSSTAAHLRLPVQVDAQHWSRPPHVQRAFTEPRCVG